MSDTDLSTIGGSPEQIDRRNGLMGYPSLAGFKRLVGPGVKILVTNHYRPQVSGERAVIKVSSSHLTTSCDPAECSGQAETRIEWPKAADATVDNDGRGIKIRWPQRTASGRSPHPRAGQPFLDIRLLDA